MKKTLLLLSVIAVFTNCSSIKKTQEAINYGNYDKAIEIAVKHLRNNKTKKGNQTYVIMLEEAFEKAAAKNLEKIAFLNKEGNLANLELLFNNYHALNNRQELIKPLLPLQIIKKRRNAIFQFNDYTNDILSTKEKLSEYLYSNAKQLLNNSIKKNDFRGIFNDLKYLNDINPAYKDTHALLDEAHYKGTDFVFVSMQNKTNMVIPMRLEEDLLNFDTYNLDDFWTVYHSNKQQQKKYDFELELNFREINISPEQVREKVIVQEKQVKDGWEYLMDENGNEVKDSLGNTIKVDKFKTIKSSIKKITQFKSVQIVGQVKYFDLKTNQLIEVFPIASEFIFEHHYATYSGNRNAINKENLGFLNFKYVPFPSNEQMIYDSGEDLKKKIKAILTRNRFR
ncbi:MAG: hypothetical protein QM495_09375 [Lutibacter sp.]|uniref:hypothetical protein n=1 Tax=Lutibacter sp. TaxID=1925666 RepID=UPI00385FE52D